MGENKNIMKRKSHTLINTLSEEKNGENHVKKKINSNQKNHFLLKKNILTIRKTKILKKRVKKQIVMTKIIRSFFKNKKASANLSLIVFRAFIELTEIQNMRRKFSKVYNKTVY